ncbi:hypothetical protein GC194_14305 [bacterium]|nr:hypothetical protein [bacterium]
MKSKLNLSSAALLVFVFLLQPALVVAQQLPADGIHSLQQHFQALSLQDSVAYHCVFWKQQPGENNIKAIDTNLLNQWFPDSLMAYQYAVNFVEVNGFGYYFLLSAPTIDGWQDGIVAVFNSDSSKFVHFQMVCAVHHAAMSHYQMKSSLQQVQGELSLHTNEQFDSSRRSFNGCTVLGKARHKSGFVWNKKRQRFKLQHKTVRNHKDFNCG